jgi:hypothetical protein
VCEKIDQNVAQLILGEINAQLFSRGIKEADFFGYS